MPEINIFKVRDNEYVLLTKDIYNLKRSFNTNIRNINLGSYYEMYGEYGAGGLVPCTSSARKSIYLLYQEDGQIFENIKEFQSANEEKDIKVSYLDITDRVKDLKIIVFVVRGEISYLRKNEDEDIESLGRYYTMYRHTINSIENIEIQLEEDSSKVKIFRV